MHNNIFKTYHFVKKRMQVKQPRKKFWEVQGELTEYL